MLFGPKQPLRAGLSRPEHQPMRPDSARSPLLLRGFASSCLDRRAGSARYVDPMMTRTVGHVVPPLPLPGQAQELGESFVGVPPRPGPTAHTTPGADGSDGTTTGNRINRSPHPRRSKIHCCQALTSGRVSPKSIPRRHSGPSGGSRRRGWCLLVLDGHELRAFVLNLRTRLGFSLASCLGPARGKSMITPGRTRCRKS